MSDRLVRVDLLLLRINLLLLLVIAFLPFPTKLMADGLGDDTAERAYVTLYGLTLLTIRLLVSALDAYARRERLYEHHDDDEELQIDRRKLWPVVAGYIAAIIIGIVAPTAAVVLYLALAIVIVVPFKDLRRIIFTRSPPP